VKQAFLAPIAQSPLLALPLLALFLFLVVFTAWIIRIYAKRSEAYSEVASLPLFDDESPIVHSRQNPTEDISEVHHVD
jgi:cbb3-type cytochrome oxidase subunit 3